MSDETVRLTYSELAKARGITLAAARRMTLRHKWPKQVGNDGLSHILVPASALVRLEHDVTGSATDSAPGDAQYAGTTDSRVNGSSAAPDGGTGDITAAVRSLSDAVASLGAQLIRERERADFTESCLQEAGDRAKAGEGRIRELTEQLATEQLLRAEDKERADRAEGRAQATENRAQEAEARVRDLQEQLQAEMIEHRRVVSLMAEQLAVRRSWWPWRR